MRSRLLRTVASFVGTVGFLSGCTALLGSFEVKDGSPDAAAADGGGTDGPVNGEAGDAATDAPGPALLRCSVNKSNIRLIDTARPPAGGFGGGGQLSFDSPHIFHIADNKTRIVARPTQSVGFTVYEIDPKNGGNQPTTIDVPTSGRIYAVQRTDDAILVLASGTGVNQGRLEVHRIADATFSDQVIPITTPGAVDETYVQGTKGPRASFTPVGTASAPDFFWTFTTAQSNNGPFDMAIGRASSPGGPQKIVYTSNDPGNPASPRALLPAGSEVFIPLEQDNNGPPSKTDSIIHTPDNALATLQATPRSMGKAGGKPNIFFGAGRSKAAMNSYNMAFLEVDTASSTAPLAFRIGAVKEADLGTFVAEDIPVSFSFASVTRLPADGGDVVWLGDNFLATGKGQGVPGINFLWFDSVNQAIRANETGPDTLLKDRMDIHRSSITLGGAPTMIFTQFDLVWTEGATFDGSMSESLYYAEVSCLK